MIGRKPIQIIAWVPRQLTAGQVDAEVHQLSVHGVVTIESWAAPDGTIFKGTTNSATVPHPNAPQQTEPAPPLGVISAATLESLTLATLEVQVAQELAKGVAAVASADVPDANKIVSAVVHVHQSRAEAFAKGKIYAPASVLLPAVNANLETAKRELADLTRRAFEEMMQHNQAALLKPAKAAPDA